MPAPRMTVVIMKPLPIVARNIKRFREEAGLSQSVLAGMVGVPPNTLSTWEQGIRKPTFENVAALAEALGRAIDDFRLENPPPAKSDPLFFALSRRANPDDPLYEKYRRDAEAYLRQHNKAYWDAVHAAKAKGKTKK